MTKKYLLAAGLLIGGFAMTGCKSSSGDSKDSGKMTPATKPAMPAKEMTHVLTKDEPCYMSMPAAGTASCGTLKAGTKVLLVIPGSPYCQVETVDGKTLYTKTESVDSLAPPPPPKPKMAMPTTKPAAAAPAMPAKTMTHMLTKAQPYYSMAPAPGAAPAGTIPAGTPVLLVIPGNPICQVETADGKTVYTPIDGVDLIPAKKK